MGRRASDILASVDIFFDLGSNQLVTGATFPQPINGFSLKRGDNPSLNLQFIQDGIVQQMPSDLVINFAAKLPGQYGGDAIIFTNVFTLTGTGSASVYTLQPSLNSTELDAQFTAVGGIEPASIPLMAEIEFITSNRHTSSQTVTLTINNDVNQGTEILPTYTGSEDGLTAIPISQDYVDVTFATARVSANWRLIVANVENSTDPAPENLMCAIITNKTNTGFRQTFSAATDTANYSYRWQVVD